MDISERLALFISYLGETPVGFSEKLGIQRSSVSHLLGARNKPSVDFLEKLLAAYPSVNLTWLIAGTGEMMVRPTPPPAVPTDTGATHENILRPAEPQPVTEPEQNQPGSNPKPAKVLLLYADGSFEVFYP